MSYEYEYEYYNNNVIVKFIRLKGIWLEGGGYVTF